MSRCIREDDELENNNTLKSPRLNDGEFFLKI
jgi:hypothetical protein